LWPKLSMPRKKKIKYEEKTNHNKRGALSKEDKEFILANAGIKSDEQIAAHIKRDVSKVREVRVKETVADRAGKIATDDLIRIREELYLEPEWEMTKKSMSREELAVFEHNYIEFMRQFKGDVLPTERKQIFSCLMTQIKLLRHNLEEKRAEQELDRLRILLDRERDKESPNEELVGQLYAQINGAMAGSKVRSDQYKVLSDKFSSGLKEIKGTREVRIQKFEETKETFIGILHQLEDDDRRKSVAIEQFIMGEGTKNELKRLSEYHTYMDGRVDKPILDGETV
jgi:hypothetical protein